MQSAWEQVSAPHTLSLSLSSLCGRPREVALTCRAGCALQGGSVPCHWEGVFHQLEPIKKYRKTCLAVVVAGTVVLAISSTSLSCRGAQHDLGHATQRGGRRPGRSLCGNAAAARFGMAQWSSNRNGLKQLKASLLCCFPMLQGGSLEQHLLLSHNACDNRDISPLHPLPPPFAAQQVASALAAGSSQTSSLVAPSLLPPFLTNPVFSS